MSLMSDPRDDAFEGRALVATFADRDSAHDAQKHLHDEGFRRTWLGVTRGSSDENYGATGSTRVESSDDGGPLGALGRFFSGETGEKTLYDELVRHGVASSTARRLETGLPSGACILTVDGSNHPELAAHAIEAAGGHVIAGEVFGDDLTDDAESTSTTPRAYTRGTEALGYGAPDQFARGERVDDERRLRLREERLNVDKRSITAGEATVGKEVVEHQQSIDVPITHEELFVERRPAGEGVADEGGEIGTGDLIRIPLMREELAVTKRAVATGEVVVGKRRVTETQHVDATTREEQLRVDDDSLVEGRESSRLDRPSLR